MIAEFTESTYGFALTYELIQRSGLGITAAPIFPSLIEEGRTGGGYDVNINYTGYPLFIQFKLSEYMVTKSAAEWYVYNNNNPYYRFDIRPSSKSKQHELLLALEAKYKNVYYAAPIINKMCDFNHAFLNHELKDKSVFVRPSVIGSLPDDNLHRVIFQPGFKFGYFCSAPREVNILKTEEIIKSIFSQSEKEKYIQSKDSIISLGKELMEIAAEVRKEELKEELIKHEKKMLLDLTRKPLETVSYLSKVLFNCEFYLVNEKRAL